LVQGASPLRQPGILGSWVSIRRSAWRRAGDDLTAGMGEASQESLYPASPRRAGCFAPADLGGMWASKQGGFGVWQRKAAHCWAAYLL